MKGGLQKIFLLLFILAIAILAIENVSAVACTLQGEVFNIDLSAAALGTNVNCTNLATNANYTTTTGTGFPGVPQYYNDFKCTMSCDSVGGGGDTVIANAYNSTHFGVNSTIMTASTTSINITMNNTFPVADTAPPTYSNISEPADPSVYGTGPYKFNISWEDNVAIDNVVLTFDNQNYSYRQAEVDKISEINSAGAVTSSYNVGITGYAALASEEHDTLVSKIVNFIVNIFLKPEITGLGAVSEDYVILAGGVYSKTLDLGAGVHNYSWWANDTSGLQNSTGLLTFNVTQSSNPVTLTLGGSSADRTITYGTTSNAVASAIGTVYLYRNNALVNQGVNPSENIVLANGTYVYFANATGNQNYSANLTGITFSLFVNKNSSSCALTVSSVTYPNPVTASCSCNNPEATAHLYRGNNNADSENGIATSLAAGGYNYICNVTSTQNYTNASQGQSITVSQGNPSSSMHLFLNGIEDNSSNTVGETSNITAYSTLGSGSSDLAYKLYNNSILVMAGNPAASMPVLPAGSYNYIYNTSGGTNWTSGTTALRNLNVSTNPPPTFSNEKKSPASPAYLPGQAYYFNITVYDLHNISSAWIMNNFTGTMQNSSANFSGNSSMREYYYSTANLAAGTYAYQWFANDTFGQPGSTSQYPYTVSQNTTSITVSLSPSNNVTYGTETTAACTINNGQAYNFTRDLLQISSPDVKTLGVNTYNYTCSFAGNQNYTGAINSSILNVSQSQSSLTLSALSWVIIKSSIATINCSANNAEAVLKIYSNNSQVNTSTLPANFLSYTANFTNSGLFNITCNRTSSQNYTYASASNNLNVTLDITAPNITIVFPTGTVGAGTTSVTINISTDETAICRYNRTNSTFDFANGINFTITNAMSHTFSWNVSDGQSYTFYYKCNDTSGNVNPASTTHSFSVASPTPPSQPGGGGGGGGGGAFPSCIENWNCSDWSDCINGIETRTCNDIKNCGTTTNKPEEQHKCAAPAAPISVTIEYKYFVTEGKEFSATASKNSEIIFYVPEQGVEVEHKMTILDVDNVKQEANIVITSEPIYITLKQNVSQQVDLNNDSINDIEITLKGTSDGNAQIAIRFIGKKPAFVIPAIPSGLTSKIYFIIAALIIVIIIIILVRKKGKRAIKHARRIKHKHRK